MNSEPLAGIPLDTATTVEAPSAAPAPRDMSGGILAAAVVAIVLLSIPAALVHDLAGTAVLGGGLVYLTWLRRHNSADVIGLFLIGFAAAPFLRRLHDLRFGFNPLSVLLMTPYLCFIPLTAEILRGLPRIRRPTLIPIVLVLGGLVWAFVVGLWSLGFKSAIIGGVEWFSGPLIFCYMALSARRMDYQRLGNWVTPLMFVEAVYGLYQWTSPPIWDAKWLVESAMTSSMGSPFPFMMRTFGTLNSTGTFAFICVFYLVAGLGWKRYVPVSILVIAALATSLVRAAWIISILGIGLAVFLQKGSGKFATMRRLSLIGLVLFVAGAPLAGKFDSLSDRLRTLGNIRSDNSFNERKQLVNLLVNSVIDVPEGAGLGSIGRGAKVTKKGLEGMDNGFIALFYMLGWAGAVLYLGGFLFVAFWTIFRGDMRQPELATMGGLVLVLFASNAFGTSFSDIGGIICWSSLGIAYLACIGTPPPEATRAPEAAAT